MIADAERVRSLADAGQSFFSARVAALDDAAFAGASGLPGWTRAHVVAHVALNVLSNYFNHLAQPDLDFPAAPALEGAR